MCAHRGENVQAAPVGTEWYWLIAADDQHIMDVSLYQAPEQFVQVILAEDHPGGEVEHDDVAGRTQPGAKCDGMIDAVGWRARHSHNPCRFQPCRFSFYRAKGHYLKSR